MQISFLGEINLVALFALAISILSLWWSAYQYYNNRPKLQVKLFSNSLISDSPTEDVIQVSIINLGRQPAFIDGLSFFAKLPWSETKLRFIRPRWLFRRISFFFGKEKAIVLPKIVEKVIQGSVPSMANSIKIEPGERFRLVFDASAAKSAVEKAGTKKLYCLVSTAFKTPRVTMHMSNKDL